MNPLSLVAVSVAIFASTNIDDLFILTGFFADSRIREWHVVSGQVLGIAALITVSLAAALVAMVIPPAYVGLLGFAPLAIGLKKLSDAWSEQTDPTGIPIAGVRGNVLAVAAVTMANGGDNIGAYTPLFATEAGGERLVTVAVFAILTLAWCAAAAWLVRHSALGGTIRHYGHRALPFVLIGLGGLILYRAGSLNLLRHFVHH